ncbi:dienelactone hydrolase family protein [Ferrovibrio sp.]|uniref:dienelactone hydrolase family protein n=1 Tax=Ferrovibrio sp. TaxID=1917215 RepID=UPI000CA652F8|nr:dienelactone hydrolase family protein [Ferrovibrio sp.]PJI43393.1 MAG: carboxymethylenebutenolidase [Ferrovibrio sp.]
MNADLLSLMPKVDFSRRGFMATSLITGFTVAAGPVMAQTAIKTDTTGLTAGEVDIPVPGGTMKAYRAQPSGAGPFPTILVVQEIFGVHEYIKDTCRRFAKQGFQAIAGDLYARQADMSKVTDMQGAVAVAGKVPDKQVMADLDATAAWAARNGGNPNKLGITGFCWGGRITWLYAAHNPKVKAGVAWYGRLVGNSTELTPKHPIDLVKDLKAPVLGLYGGADQGIPVATVEQMKAALDANKKFNTFYVYPDTPHAFHADYRPSYRKEQAEDGFGKAVAFFKLHMG